MHNKSIFLISAIIYFLSEALLSQGVYEIDYNKVEIEISADGSFDVTESLDVIFRERRRGIIRKIPYKYEVDDERKNIKISNIHVSNHPHKETTDNGEKVIRIGDADKYIIGSQKYIISYTVRGAIASYADHDEFYWNMIGFGSDAPSNKSSFSITFPSNWADSITQYRAFSGPRGSTGADVVLHKNDNTIIGAHRTVLPPYHGVTMAVKIPKGMIINTGSSHSKAARDRSPVDWMFSWWNVIPIGLGAFLLGLWRKFEKQDAFDEDIEDRHYPPQGMSPAEVGTFYDHRVNRRDIISLLPYWGNQGLISIKPVSGTERDMYFSKLSEAPYDFPIYQKKLFDDLFKDNDLVLLSDLQEQFYSTMSKTSSLLKKEVKEKELYDAQSKRVLHSGWLIALGLVAIALGIFVIIYSGAIVGGIGLFIIGIVSFVLHFKPAKLSQKGVQFQNHLKGLYNFLKNPDQEKVASLLERDPDYLHHIYPYVLAFDLDQSWTAFQKDTMSYGPPIWYDGTSYHNRDSFSYRQFSDSFDVRKIEKVFYSTPPPQSSSGSSGGGFSGGSAGGGFGGGSTSSW